MHFKWLEFKGILCCVIFGSSGISFSILEPVWNLRFVFNGALEKT